MKKLRPGLYQVPHCSLYFKVIKVQYDNGIKVKLKGGFIDKKLIVSSHVKNYTLIYDNIQHWERVSLDKTYCKDCGIETKPGSGSARCPSCWADRLGGLSEV